MVYDGKSREDMQKQNNIFREVYFFGERKIVDVDFVLVNNRKKKYHRLKVFKTYNHNFCWTGDIEKESGADAIEFSLETL